MGKRYFILAAGCVAAMAMAACRGERKADPIQEIRNHIVAMSQATATPDKNAEKAWAADSLDFDLLAASGLWGDYLNEWVALYRKSTGGEFDTKVTAAAKKLLLRAAAQSPDKVKPLVRTLCGQLAASKNLAPAAAIAAYPSGFDLPGNTYSEIAERLLGAVMLPGRPAPAIEGAGAMPSPPPSATILLFYETGCRTCGPIIEQMSEAYDVLLSRNVRIITVSSDTDRAKFETYAAQMPWPDKLCDRQGFSGVNFKSYRVAATPTLWVINDKGVVVDQYSNLGETGLLK